MATMTLESTANWSYNATAKLTSIVTFKNPSSSERAEISSIVLYLGSVNGTCTAGRVVTGNGSPITTYLSINGTTSNNVTVTRVTGVTDNPSYPIISQTDAYTFTFSPAVSIAANSSASVLIQCPSGGKVLAFNGKTKRDNGTTKPNGKPVTIYYENIPNIAPSPTSVTISCTSFTATKISWKVTTGSTATDCRVYLDGSLNSTNSMSGNSASGTISSVTSTVHTLRAEAKNNNSSWVGSNTITVDCTIPSIYNARITPSSSTKGVLSFTSDYNINYSLDGTSLGSVNADVNPNKTVTLSNNQLASYTLSIARRDNTSITNSTIINNVDTRVPIITLSYKVNGTSCTFTATSNTTCNNWYYTLDGAATSITNTSTTSVSGTINNLQVNKTYTLIVYATKVSNNLQGVSNSVYPKATGCARIFDNNTSKVASIYIWVNGKWVPAIPYIWDNGVWKLCV